jgi:hypothetical protein
MINLSDDLLFNSILLSDIHRASTDTVEKAQARYDKEATKIVRYAMFRAQEIRDAVFEETDATRIVQDLFDLAQGVKNIHNSLVQKLKWFETSPEGIVRKGLRSTARLILFRLWREGKIILPIGFGFRKTVNLELRRTMGTELLRFISSYEADQDAMHEHGVQVEYRVTQHSLSWIYSTDWHKFSDITLEEVFNLNSHLVELHQSATAKFPPPSVLVVINILSKRNLLSFTSVEVEQQVKCRAEEFSGKRSQGRTTKPYVHGGRRNCGYFSLPVHLNGTRWEFPESIAKNWNTLFDQFMDYRRKKGFEDNRFGKNLYAFADYISFFLPQFCHEAQIDVPLIRAPKDFKRYPFLDQAGKAQLFPTFVDFLESRNLTPDSQRNHVSALIKFFDWVAYIYGDHEFEHIAGASFVNPVISEFLIPKTKKRYKTNKVPFKANAFPHLIKWLYTIEKFGDQLTKEDGKHLVSLKLTHYNDHYQIQTDTLQDPPYYQHQGETFRINRIPQILLVGSKSAARGLNPSALRMVILALDTGLRFQSCQWIDRQSWGMHRSKLMPDDEYFKLHINTDKSKDEPWDTIVPIRTCEMLERQQKFLERRGVEPRKFRYEDRKNSRFEDVIPLFVDAYGKVISDGSYDHFWTEVLYAFTAFAGSNGLGLDPMIELGKSPHVKAELDQGGNNKQGFLCCRLHIKRIQTPHSCRSTYVSRRSGATDLTVIADLIGHLNEATTAHYDYPDMQELLAALKSAEEDLQQPELARTKTATIKHGPAAIKARSANSALQKSFRADRNETIHRFRMISLSSALSEADATGIQILRQSPAATIVFRDTHICPVGEECPVDVIQAAGGSMRCGVCKLSCKSIDHLPAITAKIRALKARIAYSSNLFLSIKASGDRKEELNSIAAQNELDSYELAGWQEAEIVLRDMLDGDVGGIHTDEPEIIREHLQRVVRASGHSQFLAERLLDSDAYPALITDDLRIKAGRLLSRIRRTDVEELDPDAEIKALSGALKSRMKALGIKPSEAGMLLDNPSQLSVDTISLITAKDD